MPREGFVDENGGVYRSDSLWRAAEVLPLSIYHIDPDAIFDEAVQWQLDNFWDFLVHFKKVMDADLNTPLIVRSDGYVMDGWHRIIKAIYLGIQELPQKKFVKDPQPDYFKS